MVIGLEAFREAFKGYEDCYTIIGGTACDILMNKANLDFRAFLIDIDEKAMKDAVRKYNLEDDSNVIIMVRDFLGLTRDDYLKYIDIAIKDIKNKEHFLVHLVLLLKW